MPIRQDIVGLLRGSLVRQLERVLLKAARASGAVLALGATGSVAGNRPRIGQLQNAGFEILGEGLPFDDETAQYLNEMRPVVMICRFDQSFHRE